MCRRRLEGNATVQAGWNESLQLSSSPFMILRTLRWLTPLFCGALTLLALPSAHAAMQSPVGLWKGTIGSAAVMVCLAEHGDSEYYYVRHQRGIRLALPSKSGHSDETLAKAWSSSRLYLDELVPATGNQGGISGRWRLEAKSDTELSGTWTSPNNRKTAPIRLTKVFTRASQEESRGNSCAEAYYEPLRASVQLKYKDTEFEGHTYREVSSEQASSFEVPPDTPYADKLNRYALDWLRHQSVTAYECNMGKGGTDSALGSSLKPIVWTSQFIVLEDLLPDTYCGGAHSSFSISFTTWSLTQGMLVDPWTWLRGGRKGLIAHTSKNGETITSGLFKLIVKAHPRNVTGDDCNEVMDMMTVDSPYPTSKGLVFATSFFHAMRACGDDVKLSWKQVSPYLSEGGRAVMENWAPSVP